MSSAEKAELIRRELAREAREGDFEANFVRSIVRVAKAMGGWKIEDILKMPILRYMAVQETLTYDNEEQRKEMEKHSSNRAITFR